MSLGLAVRSFLLAMFVGLLCFQPAQEAVAAVCDSDFMKRLKSQAWMEGQREVEVAAHLIREADSVFKYSCFGRDKWALENEVKFIFSDRVTPPLFTSNPPTPSLLSDYAVWWKLSKVSKRIVSYPLGEYLSENRVRGVPFSAYTYGPHKKGLCDTMNHVWNFVRCQNLQKNLFMPLSSMPGRDRRKFFTLPKECPGAAAHASNWVSHLAFGASIEPVNTFNDDMNRNAGCGGAVPIPTGVRVFVETIDYADAVCSIPGCSYDNDTNRCF